MGLTGIYEHMPTSMQRCCGWRARLLTEFPALLRVGAEDHFFKYLDSFHKRRWVLRKIKSIVEYAQKHNPFYRSLYRQRDFDASQLKDFSDIRHIPIVTKEMLRAGADAWLKPRASTWTANTGGTTGTPLCFCLSRRQRVRERYYMHKIWKNIGCHQRHNRLLFKGTTLGRHNVIEYGPKSGAYHLDTYSSISDIYGVLEDFFSEVKIHFFHGYPSSIYNFCRTCLDNDYYELLDLIRANLRGVLYSSEHPWEQYTSVVERALGVPSISWYGQSEKAILAQQVSAELDYAPYMAYGFAEVAQMEDGRSHIIGTSYDNFASPFIRYDTGDSASEFCESDGLLQSFRVADGRLGEFILDESGSRLSLTALIFGRHHDAFRVCEFIQIAQESPGVATLYYTTKSELSETSIINMFDFSGVNMAVSYARLDQPIRTKAGKVPLLISHEDVGRDGI